MIKEYVEDYSENLFSIISTCKLLFVFSLLKLINSMYIQKYILDLNLSYYFIQLNPIFGQILYWL